MSWETWVVVAYIALLVPCSALGLHRLWLVLRFLARKPLVAPQIPAEWPHVTVQLPSFNERHVLRRLVEAAGKLDYPLDRLEIQVLDDSTDDTRDIARAEVAKLRARGIDAVLLHRTDRVGFKAGALEAGLSVAKGELIAVFDADFVPSSDFLRQMVPHFAEGVGMVQARWGHLNADESWLTRAQATLLDGHFVVEHSARFAAGRWFNFNGTAGIWRREAIAEAGGWQHDTLTEDLDLSYRAQLAGWRFVYLSDVVQPAELPADMPAFKSQQHRWAKGTIQVAQKLIGPLWRSDAPLGVKVDATVHLLANLAHPLTVGIALLLPLAVVARGVTGLTPLFLLDLFVFGLATSSFALFYAVAVVYSGGEPVVGRLLRLPVALALGLGLALAQTKAVLEGAFGEVGSFVRTPKRGEAQQGLYRAKVSAVMVLEVGVALYLWAAFGWALMSGYFASLPFLALFAGGYSAVAVDTVRDWLPSQTSPELTVALGGE
ncbi:MAG: glycosyltransferase family 2 protein [Proteobacteria bacterium]|nr:glycosyltransferase family 2 protein [Pseudomonadota bacterium]